ncbi:MAG: hypothetical protein ACPG31_01680 [Planctomycetota bacterium]
MSPDHPNLYSFWYRILARAAGPNSEAQASLLKCAPVEDNTYLLTVAFQSQERIDSIVEIQATANPPGFRFGCPFVRHTKSLAVSEIGNVVFHHAPDWEREKAIAFVSFKEELSRNLGVASDNLDYYCFESLDALLASYGIVFDARKCNWLAQDLGFLDADGSRFVTGTGDPDFRFEYISDYLPQIAHLKGKLYPPMVMGAATYYGGYGLSRDSLPTLKSQFRAALLANPQVDFLQEFRKERGSSIQRHFTYFVISAFLYEAAIDRVGFEGAMGLACSGKEGEQFFPKLQQTLGVTESGFHAFVVELIQA